MLAFWCDPSPTIPITHFPDRVDTHEALARARLPAQRRVVRPLHSTPIIVPGLPPLDDSAVLAHWGLVPEKTAAPERRATAARNTVTVKGDVFRTSATKALWHSERWTQDHGHRRAQCLVPACGWIHRTDGGAFAFTADHPLTTLAGIFDCMEVKDARVYTFTILVIASDGTPAAQVPYQPAIVLPSERKKWMAATDPHAALEFARVARGVKGKRVPFKHKETME
jgi:putative SOS response-associated peptidase YedK